MTGALKWFEGDVFALDLDVLGERRRSPPAEVITYGLSEFVRACHVANLVRRSFQTTTPRFRTGLSSLDFSVHGPRYVAAMTHIDLSHNITNGMVTYPGLPAPTIGSHLTREAAEEIYGPGITFQIGLIEICTNTGTYLDVPFHRFADGHDLTGLELDRVAGVDAVCLDRVGETAVELRSDDVAASAGKAVLIRTGHSKNWGTDSYFVDHPYLTEASAILLRDANVACVGIDTLNIDSTEGGERPVHTTLLGADIPIVEHLTGLDQLPATGFTFTAVPPKIEGAGTFTVRAFATV